MLQRLKLWFRRFLKQKTAMKGPFLELEKLKIILLDPEIPNSVKDPICSQLLHIVAIVMVFRTGSYTARDYIELRDAVDKLKDF